MQEDFFFKNPREKTNNTQDSSLLINRGDTCLKRSVFVRFFSYHRFRLGHLNHFSIDGSRLGEQTVLLSLRLQILLNTSALTILAFLE